MLRGQHQLLIVPPGQRFLLTIDLPQSTDHIQAGVLPGEQLAQIQARPDLIVGAAPCFPPFDAEFRPVIDRRDPRQAEEQDMHRKPLPLVAEFGMDAFHVVVVHKAVERPAIDPVLHEAVERVGNLKIVMVIVAAVEGFVQGIVRHGVQHLRIDPALVLPVNDLAHQPELRFHGVREASQCPHEIEIQNIRRVQTQSVDVELCYPEAYRLQVVIDHLGVSEVELCQQIIAAPVVVGKAVVVLVVVPEVDVAVPVSVWRLLLFFLQVTEGEEVTSAVVEHRVQNHPDAAVMAVPDKGFQILIAAEPPIQPPVVCGVIAMAPRLE